MYWGHKTDGEVCHAGTSATPLPPVKMRCLYEGIHLSKHYCSLAYSGEKRKQLLLCNETKEAQKMINQNSKTEMYVHK